MRRRVFALFAVPMMIPISFACGADSTEMVQPSVPSNGTVPVAVTSASAAEDEQANATSMSPAATPEAADQNDNSSAVAGGMDGPVVFRAAASDGMDALGQGTLRLTDGCLVLEIVASDAAGSNIVLVYVPIFPHGTSWSADELAVRLPSGETIGLGVDASFGGGEIRVEQADVFITAPSALDHVGACHASQGAEALWVI